MTDDIDTWRQCQETWLNQLERRTGRNNTRRAYEADVRDFVTVTGKHPGHATATDVQQYVAALADRAAAPATVNRKLAALSSLCQYGQRADNPFALPELRDRRTTQPVDFPTTAQVYALLCQIETDTPVGLRNLALLAGLVATTRRVGEWVSLRWADVRDGDWFSYRCKGGSEKVQAMPPAIWRLIVQYLDAAHRLPLAGHDYLFVALSDSIERLGIHADGHLHPGYVARLVRRYGIAAGIPETCLYPHALRHAGAELRREHGAGPLDLQRVLAHERIETTIGYLRRLDRPVDPYADSILTVLPVSQRRAR